MQKIEGINITNNMQVIEDTQTKDMSLHRGHSGYLKFIETEAT